MSDPMPAIRNILGMRDWQGDGWTPPTPTPDYADVVAERLIQDGGTSISIHELGRTIREGWIRTQRRSHIMTAAEAIKAAIDKLEALKRDRGYAEVNGWLVEDARGDTIGITLPGEPDVSPVTNDQLFLVLHRTIDAQLTILRRDLEIRPGYLASVWENAVVRAGDLALAEAILGGDS